MLGLLVVATCAVFTHGNIVDVELTAPVPTSYGPVRGGIYMYDGTVVHVFRSVPYAAPPMGERRFAPPQSPLHWTDPLDVSIYGNRCVAAQWMDHILFYPPREAPSMGEDCLYLQIAAPQPIREDNKKAVMVYIHGGGFLVGSSADADYEALAIHGDVVAVAMNYRLNVFGLLASNDESAPGNVGLLDQTLALRWIKENIANFGGDPDRITIFGISSGGSSVSAHVVSPLSRGLFHRAISQSGSLYGSRLETREARAARIPALAEAAGCHGGSESELLDCLRNTPAHDLLRASMTSQFLPIFTRGPKIGGDFLPASVTELYDTHQADTAVDYVMGVSSEEGGVFVTFNSLFSAAAVQEALREGVHYNSSWVTDLETQLADHLQLAPGSDAAKKVNNIVKNQFIKDNKDQFSVLKGLMDIYGGSMFVAPTIGTAQKFRDAGGKAYVYYLDDALGVQMPVPYPQPHLVADPRLQFGALHGSDIFYTFALHEVFDVPTSLAAIMPENDRKLASSFVHFSTTLAKTGRMEYLHYEGHPLDWLEYGVEENYLVFQHPMMTSSLRTKLYSHLADYWNKLIPAYLRSLNHGSGENKGAPAPIKDEL